MPVLPPALPSSVRLGRAINVGSETGAAVGGGAASAFPTIPIPMGAARPSRPARASYFGRPSKEDSSGVETWTGAAPLFTLLPSFHQPVVLRTRKILTAAPPPRVLLLPPSCIASYIDPTQAVVSIAR